MLTAGVVFEIAPAGGVRIRVISQAPLRSGIGGSSTYGIALGRALATAVDVELPVHGAQARAVIVDNDRGFRLYLLELETGAVLPVPVALVVSLELSGDDADALVKSVIGDCKRKLGAELLG